MMVTADPRANLQLLAQRQGVSLAQLSAMIGRNPSYLQQFVRKGSPRKLEEGDRRKLAGFFGVAEGELGAPEEISHGSRAKATRGEWALIPRLALGASAGAGAFSAGEEPIGALSFGTRWLREQGLDPARLSTILVDGDSMNPTLRDGDEILVDSAPRPWRDGIHVVRADGTLMVKRLAFVRPGVIALVSDNKAYDRLELASADVEVIGRVVWKGGRL